jgi:hypothetical protein
MAFDADAAYAQIKQLENSGQIALPVVQETVEIGIVDPKEGTFGWTVPTLVQTLLVPPHGEVRTNTYINTTVGVLATKAVDLRLKFGVIPQSRRPVVEERRVARAAARAPVGGAVGPLTEWNGGVTISGYPTVSSTADEITIDVGGDCSTIIQDDPNLTPAVTRFLATITFLDHDPIDVSFFVLRPPVLGTGAFTIPALPMTIVYAPPQGKAAQNKQSYSDTATLTRTVTSALTTTTSTKTAQAYSASDLIGKASAAIASVVAVVGTGGTAGGATVVGALEQLGQAVFGPIKSENDSTAAALGQAKDELANVANVLAGFQPSTTSSDQVDVKTEDDHSVTLTFSSLSQYESEQGLGPGLGDRIVYMSNVKVVWMVIGGEVDIVILGYDGVAAQGVKDLLEEQQSLANGGTPNFGLDETTIKYLIGLDPLVAPSGPLHIATGAAIHPGPPVVGPPRFVPADPKGRQGTGTGPDGDIFEASFDTTTEQIETTTHTQTAVTDVKPAWIPVLFGVDENQETTTTTTYTTSETTDSKSEDKVTCTITLFSEGVDDPYDVKIFYDRTFGTYAILDASSPLLQGVYVGREAVAAPA